MARRKSKIIPMVPGSATIATLSPELQVVAHYLETLPKGGRRVSIKPIVEDGYEGIAVVAEQIYAAAVVSHPTDRFPDLRTLRDELVGEFPGLKVRLDSSSPDRRMEIDYAADPLENSEARTIAFATANIGGLLVDAGIEDVYNNPDTFGIKSVSVYCFMETIVVTAGSARGGAFLRAVAKPLGRDDVALFKATLPASADVTQWKSIAKKMAAVLLPHIASLQTSAGNVAYDQSQRIADNGAFRRALLHANFVIDRGSGLRNYYYGEDGCHAAISEDGSIAFYRCRINGAPAPREQAEELVIHPALLTRNDGSIQVGSYDATAAEFTRLDSLPEWTAENVIEAVNKLVYHLQVNQPAHLTKVLKRLPQTMEKTLACDRL